MKNKNKRILLFGVVLTICLVLIVITGCEFHKKTDDNETTYQDMLNESQETLKILEKENAELKNKNKELGNENNELQTKLTQAMSEKSDMTTHGQALADLIDIYELYKSGKTNDATAKLKKIEPMGFDDATLAYYEILKDVLEK